MFNIEQNEEITPFENKHAIDSEGATVNDIVRKSYSELYKDVGNDDIITIDDREPKQMFDELKKESLN